MATRDNDGVTIDEQPPGSNANRLGNDEAIDPVQLAANGEQFNPEIHLSRDGKPVITRGGNFRRKRGSGARNANPNQAQTPRSIPLESFAGTIVIVHAAIAGATNIPEIAIDDAEGKNLARAIAEVQSHYGAILDPKTEAWIKLAIVAGSMYVPRVLQVQARLQMEKALRRAPPPQSVEEALAVQPNAQDTGAFAFDYSTPPPPGT